MNLHSSFYVIDRVLLRVQLFHNTLLTDKDNISDNNCCLLLIEIL